MINVKRFIDKVSAMESRQGKDVVIPIGEARGLRDEVSKLITDNYELLQNKASVEPAFQVEINGGRF
jgi:acid phosphatase class B